MHVQLPRFETRLPARRTLERDHGFLSTLLRPGLRVLDVGCAAGSVTAGIAAAVAPGSVVGVDRDPTRLEHARSAQRGLANLRFAAGDVLSLAYEAEFDIVTAARLLQWIASPSMAVARLTAATRPTGTVVILDFDHTKHQWEPEPPPEFRRFFDAFLDWREAIGLDNRIAEHLPELLREAGLVQVESHVQDEIVVRGDHEFAERASVWLDAMDGLGDQLVAAGFLTRAQRKAAASRYREWVRAGLVRQRLHLRAAVGTRP